MQGWAKLIQIKIAIDPRARRPPRFVAGRPPYKPKPEVEYETAMRAAVQAEFGERLPSGKPIKLEVLITFRRPKKPPKHMTKRPQKSPDGDNVFKACADACNKLVFVDDKQIVEGTFTRWWGDNGAIEIVAHEWSE